MADSAQRVKEVFQEAAQLEPSERSAYLDAVCGRDTALRSAVDSLLAAEQQAGSFLESPPLPLSGGLSPELRDSFEKNLALYEEELRKSRALKPDPTHPRVP